MTRRPASVTQADVARCIRAAMAAGLTVHSVTPTPQGVVIKTTSGDGRDEGEVVVQSRERPVL